MSVLAGRPLLSLTLAYVAWKCLILTIALTSPGIGYDTSTALLTSEDITSASSADTPTTLSSLVLKLVRWDAIYFTQISRRGHLYEQEWAFGKGVSSLISTLTRLVLSTKVHDSVTSHAVMGIAISHLAHFGSVLSLWKLTSTLASEEIAYTSAMLHVLSPAGVFLSAPYSEAIFSCLNMLGILFYVLSKESDITDQSLSGLLLLLTSGLTFGCATMIRSNGILSGLLLLWDALALISAFFFTAESFTREGVAILIRLIVTVVAGCSLGIGSAWPQFLAYQEYCTGKDPTRPWCQRRLPLIYEFVQAHYWNVGFLRYWTVSNLPLFLLALPCLYLLTVSGIEGMQVSRLKRLSLKAEQIHLVQRIALPQLILACLALTNYHVQIITRLSSGYPWWYIWLATQTSRGSWITTVPRWMVIYGLIQAGLFAAFLPPA